ncbi:MAG: aspartate aminotransferase family protein [Chloroflexi bacterium]|nr:aspartate aminotransferase family protein [Chloroflexota bacterium]
MVLQELGAPLTTEEIAQLRQDCLDHLWIQTRQWNELAEPDGLMIFTRGQGVRVYDATGREYIDAMSGLWVVNAGHGRTEIAEAAYEQMQQVTYINTFAYATPPTIKLAKRVAQLTPGDLSHVYFVNSGSEAVETALKMARQYHYLNGQPGRTKFISRRGSYHGQTMGALSVNFSRMLRRAQFEPLLPGVVHVPNVTCYRCPYEKTYPSCDVFCARAIEQAIEQEGPETVAAIIAEPVSTAAGTYVPPAEYWPTLRTICDKHGILLIADEVINGFGRTGRWFAQEHFGVVADIMTVAKALGSGYLPIAAAIASDKVFDRFKGTRKEAFQHGITFGGHAVAAAAALKNLEIMEREHLIQNSAEMGRYLLDSLQALRAHPTVGDVRGIGLMAALELVKDKQTKERFAESDDLQKRLTTHLLKRGILTRAGDIIQLAPPLCATKADIDELVAAVDGAIGVVEQELGITP